MRGLIFIPDISGFTNFVKNIEINDGVSITRDLLSEIIDKNPLNLELSEIEGDALLFYKIGKPIPLDAVLSAFYKIYEAFNRKYKSLKEKYNVDIELSLKFILHYGEMSVYNIKGFRKLYGQTIIESHRLLKTGTNDSNYILITEDYIKALKLAGTDTAMRDSEIGPFISQFFSNLREIGYYYFNNFSHSPLSLKSVETFT